MGTVHGEYSMKERPDVSVILPCRNEEATVGICVDGARNFLKRAGLTGEVIVVDNGSEDASAEAAEFHGAVVLKESAEGYGKALRAGIAAARGEVLLMADSDTTYDMAELRRLYRCIKKKGCDMVIGNRFAGGIEPGAMPLSHMMGVVFLSALGRLRFHTDVRDFHCGMRGMTRRAAKSLKLKADGMEFATEMIAGAAARGMRIGQVPVSLKKCVYPRQSKLRAVRDGFRHLGMLFRRCAS